MSALLIVPWTEEQVELLNAAQRHPGIHPYTCGMDSRHRPLVATTDGWACEDCDYVQTWAFEGSLEFGRQAQRGYEKLLDAVEGVGGVWRVTIDSWITAKADWFGRRVFHVEASSLPEAARKVSELPPEEYLDEDGLEIRTGSPTEADSEAMG